VYTFLILRKDYRLIKIKTNSCSFTIFSKTTAIHELFRLILGVVTILFFVIDIQQGLRYYLKGPENPFNAAFISGEIENVKEVVC